MGDRMSRREAPALAEEPGMAGERPFVPAAGRMFRPASLPPGAAMGEPPRGWPRRCLRTAAGLLATLAVLALGLGAALLQVLAPHPGEWSHLLRIGPFERAVSMPALIRILTHPVGLGLLDGRSTDTSLGRWSWRLGPQGRLRGTCAPCTLRLAALGPRPLTLPRAELSLLRQDQNRFHGVLELVQGPHRVPLRWRARLAASGLAFDAELDEVPLATAYAVFGRTAIPELARARIEGSLAATLKVSWPQATLKVRPRVEGFAVAGLGTEALLAAEPPRHCRPPARPLPERIVGWLPRAVVAAEDQRFFEHPGYDLAQWQAAWTDNQRPGAAPQGASTITQQLAKLVHVGDERSVPRKLRELLYAVEMERTLGKGRILQLYLALAPWGDGVCGAEAAARHHLRKPTNRLTPLEAAWLASLLRGVQPSEAGAERIDRLRVGWVLASMRGPLPAERRAEQMAALRDWAPPAARDSDGR